MSIIIGILLTFLVFLFVVVIHELGHFSMARLTGMKVLEFGFGIPPKLKTLFTDKKGTEFTFNWLPFGGFVRIFGEDLHSPDAFKKGAFMSKSLPKRLLVLVAGVVMNFLLAWVIFSAIFFTGARPLAPFPLDVGDTNSYFMPSFQESLDQGLLEFDGITLTPVEGMLAEKSGILPGDKVLSVNGKTLNRVSEFSELLALQNESTLLLQEKGTDKKREIKITPIDGKIGAYVAYENMRVNRDMPIQKFGIIESMKLGLNETYASSVITFKGLGYTMKRLLFPKDSSERESAQKMLSGPIGIGGAVVSMVDMQVPVMVIWIFIALISVNLGVLNILPFPALDGGRMFTTCLYSIFSYFDRGKQKFLQAESIFHAVGFVVLLLLMIYVAGLDILRFF